MTVRQRPDRAPQGSANRIQSLLENPAFSYD